MVGNSRTVTVGRAGSKWQNRIGQSAVPEGKAWHGKVQYGIAGYCTYSKVQCRLVVCWWSVGGRLVGCRLGVDRWSLGGRLVVGQWSVGHWFGFGWGWVRGPLLVGWSLGVNWGRLVVGWWLVGGRLGVWLGVGWVSVAGRFRFVSNAG